VYQFWAKFSLKSCGVVYIKGRAEALITGNKVASQGIDALSASIFSSRAAPAKTALLCESRKACSILNRAWRTQIHPHARS